MTVRSGLTWHQRAVPIWIVATEDGACFVPIHDNVEGSDCFRSGSIAKVLAVDATLVAPTVDVVLGMLSELNGLIQTLRSWYSCDALQLL